MDILIYIVIFVVGLLSGALITRNNIEEVNQLVDEAKELTAKAEAELAEFKAKQKKTSTKKSKKPATKK